jgi:carbon-monoxide dehydrogenase medium subunit
MKPAPFDYARAASVDEAISLLAGSDGDARPVAGGQSMGPMLNFRLARPSLLVDISRIEELTAITETADEVTVGAAVTHAAFEDGEVPDVAGGLIRHAASGIAYRAVRNRGTIGGSLAHADPAADWPPLMMALDAVIGIRGAEGGREVAASDLITDVMTTVLAPGEILSSIRIPRLSSGATWGHYKVVIKPGDFPDSLAVVVRDRERGHCRAVIAGRTSPPVHLAAVARLIDGADGWTETLGREIKDAADADIGDAGFGDPSDRYLSNLHRTAMFRAAREALSP